MAFYVAVEFLLLRISNHSFKVVSTLPGWTYVKSSICLLRLRAQLMSQFTTLKNTLIKFRNINLEKKVGKASLKILTTMLEINLNIVVSR